MAIPIITSQVVNATDSPNAGRIKWNNAIQNLIADRTNFVRSDGTTPIAGDIDFNGYKGINVVAGVEDNDTATVIQVKNSSNKPFGYHQIYVQPQLPSTYVEYIYADGTTNPYAIRCDSLYIALTHIPSDSTSVDNAWTINLYGGSHNLEVANLTKVVNFEGHGNPTINVLDTPSSNSNIVLNNKGTTKNCKVRAYQIFGDNDIALTLEEGVYKNCLVYALSDPYYANPSSIVVKSAVVTESDMIATNILMDSTATNGMVDNNRLSVDLGNYENNVNSASNRIISNLQTIYDLS